MVPVPRNTSKVMGRLASGLPSLSSAAISRALGSAVLMPAFCRLPAKIVMRLEPVATRLTCKVCSRLLLRWSVATIRKRFSPTSRGTSSAIKKRSLTLAVMVRLLALLVMVGTLVQNDADDLDEMDDAPLRRGVTRAGCLTSNVRFIKIKFSI